MDGLLLIYGIAALLFLGLSVFFTLIDKSDGTALRRVPGLTATAGAYAMTFLYATLFLLEGRHDLILRILISGLLVHVLVFTCVSTCMYHHWATTLQVALLVAMAWLALLAEYWIADDSGDYPLFAYLFHLALTLLALSKLFSAAHSVSQDVQLAKVLLFISVTVYELIWAFVVVSTLFDNVNKRASVFVGLDLLLFPVLFVQHLYLPLRAYKMPT